MTLRFSLAELHQYYSGVRKGALFIAVLGMASAWLAAYLWQVRSPVQAMAWPLFIIGLFELNFGLDSFLHMGSEVRALEAYFGISPQIAAGAELQRMVRVNRNLRIYRRLEVIALAVGLFLALVFRTINPDWSAVGMGTFLQAAVLLLFNRFAERRALAYTRWLSTITGQNGG